MKKKIIAAAFAMACAAGISGCASESSRPSESSTVPETINTTASPETELPTETGIPETTTSKETPSETETGETDQEKKDDKYYADIVSKLLEALSTGITKNNKNEFYTYVEQKYSVGFKDENEHEIEELRFSSDVSGSSVLNMSDEFDDGSIGERTLYEMMSEGEGYIQTSQMERVNYYCNVIDKDDKDKCREETQNYEIGSDVTIRVDDKDFYLLTKSAYYDFSDNDSSQIDIFNGRTEKKSFLEITSPEFIERIKQQFMFMDTWDYLDEFGYFAKFFREKTDIDDPAAVQDFITGNEVTIAEEEDKLAINFKLDINNLMKDFLEDEDVGEMPCIVGYVQINRKTGDFELFRYDLRDYYEYLIKQSMKEKEITDLSVEEFIVCGISLDLEDHAPNNDITYKKYDNPEEFLGEMLQHIDVSDESNDQ